jgi:hypothetical protein
MNEDIIEGTEPTEEEKFYMLWGLESLKNNISILNKILRQLVTLDTALLGGSIAFLNDDIINYSFKIWVVFLFFLSLIIAFIGNLPYESRVDLRKPQRIKEHKEKTFKHKRRYLWGSAIVLALGLGIAFAGMVALKYQAYS